ncbi:MAG: alpha/beta hydrolase, partial [Planctomycetes bacterium]|nr:alpha/beta hydrolase [Planctomycetota bacterium]
MRISRSTALLAAIVPSLLANPMTAQSTSYPSQVYGTYSQNGQTRDLLLDLLVPVGSGPWPLLVWVHGGGWQGGNRLPIPASASRQLARGYAVASIDYRLSGTATWPAQIHDCKAAIRFLRANANSYGLDPDRIAVMGSSAGGHLVAALGTMGGVGATTVGSFAVDLEGTVGSHLGTSSRVQCVVDLYGPTTMLHAHDFPTFDHDAPTAPEALLIGGALPLNPEKWASVDPITFVSADDPPLLALHGTDDTTVPFHQSVLLLDALQAIGADAALFAVQDTGHGGAGFGSPAAEAAIDTFLDGHLRDLPAVTIGIAAVDPSANENGDPAAFELSRSGSTQAPLTVRLDLGGDVTAHRDCAPLPLLATIPAGSATLIVSLLPFDDGLVEGDETAIARVLPSGDYRIDQTAAEAT